MSFSIVLNNANASQFYAVNTVGKDFTFAFNFGTFVESDASYELTWTLQSQNVALATISMIPQLNLDIGSLSRKYQATNVSDNQYTINIGSVSVNWKSATVANYYVGIYDNPPIYFPSLNGSSNFIRVSFTQQGSKTLLATTMPIFNLILNFKKL